MSVTFKLTNNGKEIKQSDDTPRPTTIEDVLSYCDIVRKGKGVVIHQEKVPNSCVTMLGHGFIGCLFYAYSRHHKLVLRPDDLWLTIALTFANYVDKHSEEMRSSFVTHEGKEQITVEGTGLTWKEVIAEFSNEIDKKTVDSVRDWIIPTFTTTTENDILIARVALMGAMKNYFSYKTQLCCGIPEVTLMGSLEDWQQLRVKADRIAHYGEQSNQKVLVWWRDILLPVIDKFIESYEGKVDENFWQSCANYIGGGSGPSYLSGWALAFAPFNSGTWRLDHPDDILDSGKYGKVNTNDLDDSNTIEVPMTVNDNGNEYETCFYAGGLVNTYDKETNTLSPHFDFAMFKMPKEDKPKEDNRYLPTESFMGSGFRSAATDDDGLPVSKVSLLKNRSKTLKLEVHPAHELSIVVYNRLVQCDICCVKRLKAGYQCRKCDVDVCFSCADKHVDGVYPIHESEAHPHRLKLQLFADGSNKCSNCKEGMERAWYRCTETCDYNRCLNC